VICALVVAFVSTSLAFVQDTRAVPLWTALNLSIMSVEADVRWQSSQLFVAHTSGEIDKTKTLNSLYLANILGIINGTISSPTPVSVNNPLQLLIDFKSDGPTTFQPVVDALQPLRAGGHLRFSQHTPTANSHMAHTKPGVGLEWGPEIAPLASVNDGSVSSTVQMQELVRNAHDFGIRSRFWDTASNVGTWNTFWLAGSDWVNADDLLAVSNADALAALDSQALFG
ncbi:hypothetical protein B0H13DRAFT_2066470, partial [Mycena leptocephala]